MMVPLLKQYGMVEKILQKGYLDLLMAQVAIMSKKEKIVYLSLEEIIIRMEESNTGLMTTTAQPLTKRLRTSQTQCMPVIHE